MKHVRQKEGGSECLAAVLAMTRGVPLNTVRRWCRSRLPAGYASYSAFTRLAPFPEWRDWVREVLLPYWAPDLPPPCVVPKSGHRNLWEVITTGRRRYDLSGRGIILVRSLRGAHVVAFEDNLVFDPDEQNAQSVGDFTAELEATGWWIERITRLNPEGRYLGTRVIV